MSEQTFVIVGASLAGAKAAEELRERGFDGRLVLVGAESERPYERPPLSKDYLRGESEREKAYVHQEGFYKEHQMELLTGTAVTAIDPLATSPAATEWDEVVFRGDAMAVSSSPSGCGTAVSKAILDGTELLTDAASAMGVKLDQGDLVMVSPLVVLRPLCIWR